jgi:hypothetical protein
VVFFCGFPCCAGRVGAKCIPIVTIVMDDEVGDFMKGLVCHGVLERHGSGAGGVSCGVGGSSCVEALGLRSRHGW